MSGTTKAGTAVNTGTVTPLSATTSVAQSETVAPKETVSAETTSEEVPPEPVVVAGEEHKIGDEEYAGAKHWPTKGAEG